MKLKMKNKVGNSKFIISLLICLLFINSADALTVEELRIQIEAKLSEKAKLEEENKKLEAQIQETAKQANTLQSAVKTLDATQKKLLSDLKITKSKISGTELMIKKLEIEIGDTREKISDSKTALSETLRNIDKHDDRPLIEALLTYNTAGEFWDDIESLRRVQEVMRQNTIELTKLNKNLSEKKGQNIDKKNELVDYKDELSDKESIVDQNKKAKTTLLAQTKNKEAEYKKMLERNIELGKKFEQELFEFESQLQIAIDPSRLPGAQSGILSWPLSSITITQKFGKTIDSRRLYVSGTHNGVDFRASVGTPVKAALSGTIRGLGNTDEQAGCYSYGRWILIEHPNGLSSLYAHLSASKVRAGQNVTTGEIIGYSGGQPGVNGSGYSTGPHLHLGLYATQGVKISRYSQSNFCKKVDIPIASSNSYLDPLAYLPRI